MNILLLTKFYKLVLLFPWSCQVTTDKFNVSNKKIRIVCERFPTSKGLIKRGSRITPLRIHC